MAKVNDILQNVRIMASSPYALAFPAADAAGNFTSNGTGTLSFSAASSSKIELVYEKSGVNSTISDNNFDPTGYVLKSSSGSNILPLNQYYLILWQLYPQSSITNDPRLYLEGTSTQCGVLTENNAAAGVQIGGLSFLGMMPRGSAIAWTSWSVGCQAVCGVFGSMTAWNADTEKKINIRGYPQTGGNCGWSWAIYKVDALVDLS